jgi:hypothetical protein
MQTETQPGAGGDLSSAEAPIVIVGPRSRTSARSRARGLEQRAGAALRAVGLVQGGPEVASMHTERIDYAYPVPTLERDSALQVIQPWLMERDVFSRGRFGSWLYEAGNMDHAVKMGIDLARRLATGAAEELWALRG